jgi:hypothetical protein
MDRLSSHFLRPSPTRSADGQSALVVKLGVNPSRSRLPGPHRYNSGIVQQAKVRSSETAVTPHRNNQSAIYNLQTSIPFSCEMKLAYKGTCYQDTWRLFRLSQTSTWHLSYFSIIKYLTVCTHVCIYGPNYERELAATRCPVQWSEKWGARDVPWWCRKKINQAGLASI